MQHDAAAASNEELWQLDSLEGRGNRMLTAVAMNPRRRCGGKREPIHGSRVGEWPCSEGGFIARMIR